MSSINRPLSGPMMTFDLDEHLRELRGEESYQRSGRSGRTLAKSGRMRLVLVAMAPGNEIGTHQADSPMTVHVLGGHIRYRGEVGEEDPTLALIIGAPFLVAVLVLLVPRAWAGRLALMAPLAVLVLAVPLWPEVAARARRGARASRSSGSPR
jgi:hypothetical protein